MPQHPRKRETDIDIVASHRGSLDPHFFIDAIEVPRGMPNEFKVRNKIVTGLESMLFWWFTINKDAN
jgi:hypothetical protein